jgi:hypothetical protein
MLEARVGVGACRRLCGRLRALVASTCLRNLIYSLTFNTETTRSHEWLVLWLPSGLGRSDLFQRDDSTSKRECMASHKEGPPFAPTRERCLSLLSRAHSLHLFRHVSIKLVFSRQELDNESARHVSPVSSTSTESKGLGDSPRLSHYCFRFGAPCDSRKLQAASATTLPE